MIGLVGWMNSEIRFGQVEDEPSLPYVVMSKTELVPNKHTYFFGIWSIK